MSPLFIAWQLSEYAYLCSSNQSHLKGHRGVPQIIYAHRYGSWVPRLRCRKLPSGLLGKKFTDEAFREDISGVDEVG